MVKDNDVADDIFQETFIKVIRVIDEGRYTDKSRQVLSWVLRIAHNQVIDHFRACKQNKQVNRPKAATTYWDRCASRKNTISISSISSQIESDGEKS